jgi:hypothetical protein
MIMREEPQGIDLRAAAGDFVAGDLSDEDQQLFQAECAQDDDLQADCRFWEGLRDDLRCHGRDPSARLPGPGLAQAVRRRLANETPRRQTKPLQLFPWLLAAAAVLILVGNAYTQANAPLNPDNQLLGFTEDGAAILDTKAAGPMNVAFKPQRTINYQEQPAPNLQQTDARPWLGVWTEPVRLNGMNDRDGALLVRRVTDGTAAAKAGMRPGDVLLNLGGCDVHSRWCITHAIDQHTNAQPFVATWYRPSSGQIMKTPLELGCCWD